MRIARLCLALLSGISLGSCSLAYEIEISLRHGVVVIEPYQPGWFGGREIASVEQISVTELAEPKKTVWKIDSVATNGTEVVHIDYGKLPRGFRNKVEPLPLKTGALYHVGMFALGWVGQKYFVISPYSVGGYEKVTILNKDSN